MIGKGGCEIDSIERILEDASESPAEYFDCGDERMCAKCPARESYDSCKNAQKNDLINRAHAMFERQLPEGVEWPRFEDGGLVEIGDEVELDDGEAEKVLQVFLGCDGYTLYCETHEDFHAYGERVKRLERDTQVKIDADAGKTACEYFGWVGKRCEDDDVKCPAFLIGGRCSEVMTRDLLRRQRELCGREVAR